jgi:hypothetical protein
MMLAYGRGLAAIAAGFLLMGLAALFPGAPPEIVVLGASRNVPYWSHAAGWLARGGMSVTAARSIGRDSEAQARP